MLLTKSDKLNKTEAAKALRSPSCKLAVVT
jgi:hypothetical protein